MKSWTYNNSNKEILDNFIAKCEEIRKRDNITEDNQWKKFEERSEIIIVEETSPQNEIIQPIKTKTDEKPLKENTEEQNYEEVIEFITENFKTHQPENIKYVEDLLQREDCKNILNKISNNTNIFTKNYLENFCTAFLNSSVIESAPKTFCSEFLFPVLNNSGYSRGLESSLMKCIDVIPKIVIKFTLIPLLNVQRDKSNPFVNVAKLNSDSKRELLSSYLRNAEHPAPEWTLQILFNLFKSCSSRDSLQDLMNFLVRASGEFPQNVQFGKLLHLACQKFVLFKSELENADEMKEQLKIVLEYNETSFKNVCIGLLQK